jgi:hypothetical protein
MAVQLAGIGWLYAFSILTINCPVSSGKYVVAENPIEAKKRNMKARATFFILITD